MTATSTDPFAGADIIAPRPDFPRGRNQRPKIKQADGTLKEYTRVTTFVGAPEDLYNVQRWEKRQVAIGLAKRPDILIDVHAHQNDKRRMDEITDLAKEAAAATAAARRGTAIHTLSELVDMGRPLPDGLDSEVVASLDAYRDAMRPFRVRAIEQHLVNDPFQIAGTTDRLLGFRRNVYIADLKTGSTVELGSGKIAAQLAAYARSRPYDVVNGERLDAHGASIHWGLVIHLPADRPGTCNLHWFDLLRGWSWLLVARQVREQRAIRFRDWSREFDPEQTPEQAAGADRDSITDLIAACATADDVRALWRERAAVWTDDHTRAAQRHIAALGPGAA